MRSRPWPIDQNYDQDHDNHNDHDDCDCDIALYDTPFFLMNHFVLWKRGILLINYLNLELNKTLWKNVYYLNILFAKTNWKND